MYQLPLSATFSVPDLERFNELSLRRGLPLDRLFANPEDLRIVLCAAFLSSAGANAPRDAFLAEAERFLSEEGDWLATDAQSLLDAALDRGILDDEGDVLRNRIDRPAHLTRERLLDELESAREILARRRAAVRTALQEKNRAVNRPTVHVDEEEDRRFMREALLEAEKAKALEEVPVGAVVTAEGRIIARAHNRTLTSGDPTAHAEVLAIREAARVLGNHRLTEATLYVTLEPCPMCAGALWNARVKRVVFGAAEPRSGALGSVFGLFDLPSLNHRPFVTKGVEAERAGALLKTFFAERRGEAEPQN